MFSLNNIINPIISIILVIIVCSLIGIDKENIIIIVLISCIVLFLFKIILDINNYYGNRLNNLDNINKLGYDNYLEQKIRMNHKKSLENTTNTTNTINTKNNLPYHLQNTPDNIINSDMYNLLDCTTDKTCIQKPDENNLFVGFEKKIENKNNNILPKIINNRKNNNKFTNEEIIEHFDNKMSPIDLNDIAKPFNSTLINPYKHHSLIEYTELNTAPSISNINEELELSHVENPDIDRTDELSFHSRKGHCEGDICHSLNEMPIEKKLKLNNISKKIIDKLTNQTHPFSSNYPTIRITNPESRF